MKSPRNSLAAILLCAWVLFAGDTCSTDKMNAINEYLSVCSIDNMVDEMLVASLKNIPADKQAAFRRIWISTIDKGELYDATVKALCKTFTKDEISALTAFYSSPVGHSVLRKMSKYSTEILPYLQAVSYKAFMKAFEEAISTDKDRQNIPKPPRPDILQF